VFWNLVFSYGTTILVLVKTLFFVPWYLHHIPFKEYGAWLATGGVLSFLTIMDFGLTGVLTQQSASAYGANDKKRLGELIGTGLFIAVGLAIASGVVAAAISPFVPAMVQIEGDTAERLKYCIMIAVASNSLCIIGFAAGGVVRSLQRSFWPGILLVGSEVVNLIVIVLCLFSGLGLYSIALGLLSRGIILTIGNAVICYWVCSHRLLLGLRWVGGEARSLARMSSHVFASRIASSLIGTTDAFFIGVLVGPEAAGAFSLTTRAHSLLRSLAGRFGEAVMPSMAHLHGENRTVRFGQVFAIALKMQTNIAAIGLAGVVAFDESFVRLWVGPGVFAGHAVSVSFGVWCIGYMVGGVVWQALYAMGDIVRLSRIVWLETIVRVAAALILIGAVGILGAPVAALISQAACLALLLPLMIRRIESLHGQYWRLLQSVLARLLLPGAAAFAVASLAGPSSTWLHFAAACSVYLALILGIMAFMDRGLVKAIASGRRGFAPVGSGSACIGSP
jgi:O-antigen/teichoic acid export membrane protein